MPWTKQLAAERQAHIQKLSAAGNKARWGNRPQPVLPAWAVLAQQASVTKRNEIILRLVKLRWGSYRQIAAALGISHSLVGAVVAKNR